MGECACIYVDDYETAEFYTDKRPVARKVHKCCECGGTIKPGEKYEYVTAKWGGAISTYKTCLDCLSIRKVFFCNGWLFEGNLEHLWEHIQCMGGAISEDCIVGLTPGARSRVCGMIEEYWDEYHDDNEDEISEI